MSVEQAIIFSRDVFQFFQTRTKDVLWFVRLADMEDYEAREVGLDITRFLEESVDDTLEGLGRLIIISLNCNGVPKYAKAQMFNSTL